MTDIFVSYAHQDKERIKPLIQRLEEHGWSVWWDTHIQTGASFDMEIESAVKAARCVLVVWSKHSIDSQWVRSEAHEGLDRHILVPILIDDVRPPMPFRQLQTANFIDQSLDFPLEGSGLLKDIQRALAGKFGTLHSSLDQGTSRTISPTAKWRRPAIVALLLAIVVVIVWSRIDSLMPASIPDHKVESGGQEEILDFDAQDRVVIAGVRNLTGEEIFDQSLDHAFRIGLGQSRFAGIVSDTQVRNTLSRMKLPPDTELTRDLALEVALREQAKAVTVVTVTKVGEVYSIGVEIVDPNNDDTVFAHTAEAIDKDEVLGSLSKATQLVRTKLGESLASIEKSHLPLEKVTTADLQALKAYSTAMNQGMQEAEGDPISLLLWAIERDPQFAMAHAKLGALYATDHNLAKAEKHWAQALKYSDRLTQREKVYIQASTSWNKSTAERIRAWKLMISLFPEEAVGHHNLGMVYWEDMNNFGEAALAFRKAIETQHPWNFISMHMLGYVMLGLGQADEARQWFERGMQMEGNPLDYGIVDALIVSGRHEEVRQFIDPGMAEKMASELMQRNRKLVGFYADQGQLDKAASVAERQLKLARSQGLFADEQRSTAALLAVLERSDHQTEFNDLLQNAVNAALTMLDQELQDLRFTPVAVLGLLGKVSARNGNVELARNVLASIRPLAKGSGFFFWEAYADLLQAEIHLAEGNSQFAIEIAREQISSGDLFQAHETLARAYERHGDVSAAIAEFRWIIENRGRAFAENLSRFYGKEFNVMDWVFAHFHLGRLHEALGDDELARKYYSAFIDHWRSAEPSHWAVVHASDRLEALRTTGEKERI